jgi:site-specific DNA-cytosine methylase
MGVPEGSALTGALMDTACGTPRQMVTALGGAVHVGVGRRIVRELVQRKWLKRGAKYGSAYSGIDTFAAAVEAELGGQFTYVFASEHEGRLRRALVRAWGGHGLKATHVYDDAEGEAATHAPRVDLYVFTAVCNAHSKHNRQRSEETQMEGMEGVERALRYVEHRRPAIVVAENVNEASVVGPLGAMLRRLRGYEWEEGVLDALTTARVPVSRERYFWIGRRV